MGNSHVLLRTSLGIRHRILTTTPSRGLVQGVVAVGSDAFMTSSLPTGGPAFPLANPSSTQAPRGRSNTGTSDTLLRFNPAACLIYRIQVHSAQHGREDRHLLASARLSISSAVSVSSRFVSHWHQPWCGSLPTMPFLPPEPLVTHMICSAFKACTPTIQSLHLLLQGACSDCAFPPPPAELDASPLRSQSPRCTSLPAHLWNCFRAFWSPVSLTVCVSLLQGSVYMPSSSFCYFQSLVLCLAHHECTFIGGN